MHSYNNTQPHYYYYFGLGASSNFKSYLIFNKEIWALQVSDSVIIILQKKEKIT